MFVKTMLVKREGVCVSAGGEWRSREKPVNVGLKSEVNETKPVGFPGA